ncbi:MAG: trigger factor, partial [Gemmatimonadota bacterium]
RMRTLMAQCGVRVPGFRPGKAPRKVLESRLGKDAIAQEAAPVADTLTVERALEMALGEAPDVRQARASLDAAGASRWADWGALLPTLRGSASFSQSEFTTVTFQEPEGGSARLEEPRIGERKNSNMGLQLSWTLLDGGSNIADLLAGGAEIEAQRHALTEAERTRVAEVRRAYYEARKQQRLVTFAEEQLEARIADLERTERQYEMAAADRAALLGARDDSAAAELELMEARDAARAGVRDLAVAIGVQADRLPPETRLAEVGRPPPTGELDVGSLVARAVRSNPQLAQLAADAEAASSRVWAARADYLPTISLGYNWGWSERLGPEGDLFVLDPSNRSQGLSVNVSWDLFSGFSRRDQVAQARLTREQAEVDRTREELELERRIRDTVEELRRRSERLEILERRREFATRRLELTRERYRRGELEYLDVQNMIEALNGIEESLITERYDYLSAWASLEEDVGPLR